MNSLDYSFSSRTCRFCGKDEAQRDLVKYEVRHYAHPMCLLDARGADAFVASLSAWQLGQLPAKFVRDSGLTAAVDAKMGGAR